MLFRLQRKQPILHRVAQSEYRSRPQHPGRTLSSAARCPASATDRLATLASQPQQGGRRAFRRVGTTEEPHDVRRQKARKDRWPQRMVPPCGRPPFFVVRSEADDRFLARARVRRFSFFSFTPSPLCRKSQIDSAISVNTFGPNASPAGEAHDRTQVHPNLHP